MAIDSAVQGVLCRFRTFKYIFQGLNLAWFLADRDEIYLPLQAGMVQECGDIETPKAMTVVALRFSSADATGLEPAWRIHNGHVICLHGRCHASCKGGLFSAKNLDPVIVRFYTGIVSVKI